MKRSANCNACGSTIKPSAKDMSVGAAVRKHYWRKHPEVMLAGRAKRKWVEEPRARARRRS